MRFILKLFLNPTTVHKGLKMAHSRFEYVRSFEVEDKALPNCWIVVRIDGKGFHKFSKNHNFQKPNDPNALNLMNKAAITVMEEYKDISMAYGQSDEYSFVLRKNTEIYNRRKDKILSYINSLFTSSYVFFWKDVFPDIKLKYPPCFDSRVVLYPTDENLRDYLSWRQADCHINNLYNTTFWALIQKGGLTNAEAERRLCGTFSSDKHEILFTELGINYNNEPELFKKGTILLRKKIKHPIKGHLRKVVFPVHEDLIADKFWVTHPEILANKSVEEFKWDENIKSLPKLVMQQLRLKNEDCINDC